MDSPYDVNWARRSCRPARVGVGVWAISAAISSGGTVPEQMANAPLAHAFATSAVGESGAMPDLARVDSGMNAQGVQGGEFWFVRRGDGRSSPVRPRAVRRCP